MSFSPQGIGRLGTSRLLLWVGVAGALCSLCFLNGMAEESFAEALAKAKRTMELDAKSTSIDAQMAVLQSVRRMAIEPKERFRADFWIGRLLRRKVDPRQEDSIARFVDHVAQMERDYPDFVNDSRMLLLRLQLNTPMVLVDHEKREQFLVDFLTKGLQSAKYDQDGEVSEDDLIYPSQSACVNLQYSKLDGHLEPKEHGFLADLETVQLMMNVGANPKAIELAARMLEVSRGRLPPESPLRKRQPVRAAPREHDQAKTGPTETQTETGTQKMPLEPQSQEAQKPSPIDKNMKGYVIAAAIALLILTLAGVAWLRLRRKDRSDP